MTAGEGWSAVTDVEEAGPGRELGGMTLDEALRVYDYARNPIVSMAESAAVEEIGRRAAAEHRLLARAEDVPGVVKYVRHMVKEGHPDGFGDLLESTLDDLDRGYSDTMDSFAEWRRDRRKAKKQKLRDRVLLAEAADERVGELEAEIAGGNMGRADVSRMKRELKELRPAVARAWKKVQG